MNFDPMTGEPIKKNFDPMTGEPINNEPEVEATAQTAEAPVEVTEQVAEAPVEVTEQVAEAPIESTEPVVESATEAPTQVLTNNMSEQQPTMSFDPMTGQPVGAKPKKKGFLKSTASKVVLAIAIIAVIACGVTAVAFNCGILGSKSDKVLKAITNTLEDKGELTKAFDFSDIVESNEYTMGFSMEAEGVGMECSYLSGKSGKQLTGNVNAYSTNIDFALNLTEEELQVQIPYITDKIFTYNYTGENTGYLMEEMTSDEVEAFNKVLEYLYSAESNDKATEKLKDAVLDEYKSLEFEDAGKEEFEVDGKDRECKGYKTVITKENMQNLIDAYEEATSDSLDEMEELMVDLDPTYTMGSYADSFDELREILEEMPDMATTFYLYDNKLACIELQPKGEEAIQIQFLGGDRRAQNMRIVDEEGNAIFEVVGETDGSEETIEFLVIGESVLSLVYDSKSGELSLSSEEFSLSGSIESDKNGFTFTIDEYSDEYDTYDFEGSISLMKGADFQELDGEKFDIGNASEDEVVDLMKEIEDSLY
ncbi:hypothetical protein [Roseburia sp. 499]|uniref:hypothetical protein n=1 Tax=Roseburia sp. 499 TaxID=1261634 RepID=UPI0009521D08|nr:hypothetical protein [Roseburia sp. 499]WVK69377.1 hypothetical protein BIV20_13575 [Roseburia sp. 499]